jgi:hypothetical protein
MALPNFSGDDGFKPAQAAPGAKSKLEPTGAMQ